MIHEKIILREQSFRSGMETFYTSEHGSREWQTLHPDTGDRTSMFGVAHEPAGRFQKRNVTPVFSREMPYALLEDVYR